MHFPTVRPRETPVVGAQVLHNPIEASRSPSTMPTPLPEDPPIEAFGELVPLASLQEAPLRDGTAPWPKPEVLTDLKTQCSPLMFGGGVYGHGKYNDDTLLYSDAAVRALRLAFRYGINALDTSAYYEPSELVLGRALRILAPEYPRSSYFLITKCGRYGLEKSKFDYSPERIEASIQRSLNRLGTTYLDAALLHDIEFVSDQPEIALLPEGAPLAAQAVGLPCAGVPRGQDEARHLLGIAPEDAAKIRGPGDERVLEAARTLFKLKDQGVIRNVGMSGYPLGELVRISRLIASHPPYRPLDVILSYSNDTLHADLLSAWRPLFATRPSGASEANWEPPMLINASPFSMGLFSDRGPPAWHPADPKLLEAVQLAHARAKNAASVTDIAPVTGDNVLGYTALSFGLRNAASKEAVPTLLGMSTTEEVHVALSAFRALTAGLGTYPVDASLQEKYETLYHQLTSFEGMVRRTLQDAQVNELCWPSPAPDA